VVKLAQYVQITALPAQVIPCVKLVNQDLVYRVLNVVHVSQELTSMAKLVQHVPAIVTLAPALLSVKLARLVLVYKVTNATPVLQESI